ncbi:MAG: radical SAM protein [Myxococcales bacterium]|nr:radical SAM protein [Myxococcales bacterium]
MARMLEVVVVPSTLCNLRCSYCYELPLLGDKRRASHEALRVIFERVAEHCARHDVQTARVIWHGGEPLLLPPDYFWKAFELQAEAFRATKTEVVNVTQTNLTVLDEARIDLLANGFTDRGVSLDLFGSLRVNAAGRCQEDRARENLDALLERGVGMTGITVLTRANRRFVRRIYQFYAERGMNFRLLPLHAGGYEAGKWFEIVADDTLSGFKTLADCWFANDNAPLIHPVVGVIRDVHRAMVEGQSTGFYDKRSWEPLLIIDRDGSVYPFSDAMDPEGCYGNILESPLDEILASASHERVLQRTEQRLAETCGACSHYGTHCSGVPVAEHTQDFWERGDDGVARCTAFAGLIEHVQRRLAEHGMV